MSRFYFDIRDGLELALDEEGIELRDLRSAQTEAAKALSDLTREVVHNNPGEGGLHHMAIEVRDESGPVMDVKFTFEWGKRRRA